MTTNLYLRLHNLFTDDNEINDIKIYLENKVLHNHRSTDPKIIRFLIKFKQSNMKIIVLPKPRT